MLLYQSWNKSKLQLRNALIFFYLSICLISCLHSNPFSPSSFVLCGQVSQEEGQIADQCLKPACIWLGWEDGTTRFCEVSSEKILRRCTIFPGTIKGFRNTNEMNGKIQGYLLKQKAIYTHTLCQHCHPKPPPYFCFLVLNSRFRFLIFFLIFLLFLWYEHTYSDITGLCAILVLHHEAVLPRVECRHSRNGEVDVLSRFKFQDAVSIWYKWFFILQPWDLWGRISPDSARQIECLQKKVWKDYM